ncbi:MAG TPA: helix-turn-helix transcriptional regulator [Solirubrobacteraceae bacterium]
MSDALPITSRARADHPGRRSLPSVLADAVREARLAAGLSQVQLGERTGISQPMLSLIEGGRRSPSRRSIARLERVLVLDADIRRALIDHADAAHRRRRAASRMGRWAKRLGRRTVGAPGRAYQLAELKRYARLARLARERRQEGGRPVRRARRRVA